MLPMVTNVLIRTRYHLSSGCCEAAQVAPPSSVLGQHSPKHVNVVIQMTEVTLNIGIIVFRVSHLCNLWLLIIYFDTAKIRGRDAQFDKRCVLFGGKRKL